MGQQPLKPTQQQQISPKPTGDGFFTKMNKMLGRNKDQYFKNKQTSKIDAKTFDNVPQITGDLKAQEVKLNSNQIKVDNKQKEMDKIRDTESKDKKNPYEDISFDMRGDVRDWENWVVPTFKPTMASTISDHSTVALIKGLPSYQGDSNENVNAKFDQIRLQCKQNKTAFRDADFPAELSSIAGFFADKVRSKKKNLEEAVWLRPSSIFRDKAYFMWDKTIEPADIKQGELGDCYFLVALASLA